MPHHHTPPHPPCQVADGVRQTIRLVYTPEMGADINTRGNVKRYINKKASVARAETPGTSQHTQPGPLRPLFIAKRVCVRFLAKGFSHLSLFVIFQVIAKAEVKFAPHGMLSFVGFIGQIQQSDGIGERSVY